MKIYSVYDEQFKLFSDPFLAADDVSAERLLVQSALLSDGFRKRVIFNSLFCLGSFDPEKKRPGSFCRSPLLVSDGSRIFGIVTDCLAKAPPEKSFYSKEIMKEMEDSVIE